MLPQILASQLTDNNKSNEDSVRVIYSDCDIVLALVKQINMSNIAMLRRQVLMRASEIVNKMTTRKPIFYLDLFETYCNPDITKHVRGIIDDVGRLGYDIHVTITSEFDTDLSELLLCDYVSKVTWDRSSYVSFVELKKTAQKKQDGKLSDYGNYFVPQTVNDIRNVFNIDLSDIYSFESIYAEDGILEILKDNIKEKSVILK